MFTACMYTTDAAKNSLNLTLWISQKHIHLILRISLMHSVHKLRNWTLDNLNNPVYVMHNM